MKKAIIVALLLISVPLISIGLSNNFFSPYYNWMQCEYHSDAGEANGLISANDLGLRMITEGGFGMIPRWVNGNFSFPLITHFVDAVFTSIDLIMDPLKAFGLYLLEGSIDMLFDLAENIAEFIYWLSDSIIDLFKKIF